MNFWKALVPGFTVLAPMEDVTDTVFRRLVASWGAPEVLMSEFINATELVRTKRRFARQRSFIDPAEPETLAALIPRPRLIAQIWGNVPEDYRLAIPQLLKAGFEGIDINMGCPAVKVVRRGSCAGLIDNPSLAAELILAAREAAGDFPVSVKTRLGVRQRKTEAWFGFLLGLGLPALTVHGRIAAQMSDGEADWSEIARVVVLRNQMNSPTRVIGNGDLFERDQLETRRRESGVDGVMVGRGIFRDPLIFRRDGRRFALIPVAEKLAMMETHVVEQQRVWGGQKGYDMLKSFYKIYTRDWEGGEALRERLNLTRSYEEALVLIRALRPAAAG